MEKKYYSEEVEKDTRYRAEYLETVESFLNAAKLEAEAAREAGICLETYAAEQETYRKEYVEMLGFPLGLKREMPKLLEKTFVARDKNVEIYRMQLLHFGGIKQYGLYFKQVENAKNAPFLLGFHGGGGTPELVASLHIDSANYNHLIRRVTDKGANVFVPQLLLWNKDMYGGEYDRAHLDGKLRQLGGSMTALELYLLCGAIDYFSKNEEMAAGKIGCFGLSYGGMYALHLAALDTRVKSCYSCSWVSDVFVYSWADWSYKNAQKKFGVAEVMGLVAPRSLSVAMGDKDELFKAELTEKECKKAERYYRAFQAEHRFQWVIFNGVHEADKDDCEIDFLLNFPQTL